MLLNQDVIFQFEVGNLLTARCLELNIISGAFDGVLLVPINLVWADVRLEEFQIVLNAPLQTT